MEIKRSRCLKCGADFEMETHCQRCVALRFSRNSSSSSVHNKTESGKVCPELPAGDASYVMQIVSIGIRSDSVYEAQMLLGPDVDMSTIKITVKGKNLRVSVRKPENETLAKRLSSGMTEKAAADLIKRTRKHCENLLIPESIDGDKVRAVIDNKHRILILTAPTLKPSQTRRKHVEKV